jgi:hypothetical protein
MIRDKPWWSGDPVKRTGPPVTGGNSNAPTPAAPQNTLTPGDLANMIRDKPWWSGDPVKRTGPPVRESTADLSRMQYLAGIRKN